jgi:hypothetical protein
MNIQNLIRELQFLADKNPNMEVGVLATCGGPTRHFCSFEGIFEIGNVKRNETTGDRYILGSSPETAGQVALGY